ncbi:MAG: right-handed parallel beta-helix repeat-containing protein [Pyrinomonadaceae bacterium]
MKVIILTGCLLAFLFTFSMQTSVNSAGNIDPTPAAACTKVRLPGPNLRAFLDTLVPGDVGCLRAGVHGARGTEAFMTVSGTPSAPITLRGYPGEAKPTILGYFPIGGNNIVISGLLFDGPTGLVDTNPGANPPIPPREVSLIVIYGDNVEINHCEIRNSLAEAGIYLLGAYNARIIGNYIHDNGRFGNANTAYMDHGIYFGSGSGLIANNIIEYNWSYGIQLYPSASNVIVQQNTIIKNVQSGVIIDNCAPVGCAPQPTNNLVVNNIIAFNKVHAFQSSVRLTGATGNVIKNNLFWGNEAGDIPSDERLTRGLTYVNQNNNIADPRFVAASNYRLQFNSPAIDAALSPYTQRDDYDFIPRPQGTASDIGAFEFKLGTTAASVSVSGRVLSSRGRGVFNAVVHLTNQMGEIQTTRTNSSGYYTFKDIAVGECYTFNVFTKRYQFNPQVITLTEDLAELNFTAQ